MEGFVRLPIVFTLCVIVTVIIINFITIIRELNYCGYVIELDKQCEASSTRNLVCNNYAINWSYESSAEMASYHAESLRNKLLGNHPDFEIENISCLSQQQKMNGYLIKYKDEKKFFYRLIVSGVVREQPVIVNLTMNERPNNENMPFVVKQIITL